jgi:RNA polymerase sigma-70 factor (ECF subfamily)
MAFWNKKEIIEDTDADLIDKYRNSNDLIYIGKLYTRYTTLVYGVAMKYLRDEDLAKDATMQVFEKLISLLKKHQVENFKAWLHTIVKNHCLMELRKKNQANTSSYDTLVENATIDMEKEEVSHLDDKIEKEKDLELLDQAMIGLKDDQKLCVELFYLKDKSYNEIANITGFDIKQVKSHIQNGKRNLKILMEQNGK